MTVYLDNPYNWIPHHKLSDVSFVFCVCTIPSACKMMRTQEQKKELETKIFPNTCREDDRFQAICKSTICIYLSFTRKVAKFSTFDILNSPSHRNMRCHAGKPSNVKNCPPFQLKLKRYPQSFFLIIKILNDIGGFAYIPHQRLVST